jgi:hypothetical protein
MARGIGIATGVALLSSAEGSAAASQTAGAAGSGAAGAGSSGMGQGLTASKGAGWTFGLPWISGAVVVAAVAAIALQTGSATDETVRAPAASEVVNPPLAPPVAEASAAPSTALEPEQLVPTSEEVVEPPSRTVVKTRATKDLSEEIAVVDSARAALRSGANQRALGLVAEYQREVPKGSFRPVATALRIEALVNLGRKAEARALAERFVSTRRGTPLGDRVARIAGLASAQE